MTSHWFARLLLLPTLLAGLAGCSELTDPETESASGSELTFLRMSANAPEIEDTEVTFWAVKGQDREVQIRYYYEEDHGYTKCLRFVVPARALHQRPDGSSIAQGDSVLITIRMPDPSRFAFEFDPSGLKFHPDHPATVEVVYRYADADLNGDGVVDDTDESLRSRFAFWRQEQPNEPWFKVATSRLESTKEARASVPGFTIWALAID